jgi:hypothetical protein
MSLFAPATDVAEVELPEPGKYIVKCVGIEDAPDRGFGPGVKWIFHLTDPVSGVTMQSKYGDTYSLWQFTSTKMSPRSRARMFIEALLGRPLDAAKREVPDPRDLIGRSMEAVVIHERRDDGSTKATVTSCRPVAPPAGPGAARQPATKNGTDLVKQVKAAIRKAEILQTPNHLEWLGLEPERMSDEDLRDALERINADIQA